MAIQLDILTSFGDWLKERRKSLDMTQAELAQQVGCAEVTLRKIEAGVQRPSKQMAIRLAEIVQVVPTEQQAFVRFARGETPARFAVSHTATQQQINNLPTQPTILIGRAREIAAIRERILHNNSRLVTLIGPPGAGKTRLAIESAGRLAQHFSDGVCYVPLATTHDPAFVPSVICQSLSLQESGLSATERLTLYLGERHLLLVLDNFEHLLAAAAWVAELLGACPWLTILVTSRTPLRVRAERQLPIPPLLLPDLAQLPDPDEMGRYPAVALFMEHAQAAHPDFNLTESNKAAVASICTLLDGLPLAIELVAARVKALSPAALLARLRGRLLLDSEDPRDNAPRHQTLRQAIDWSYKLLSAPEQLLLVQLGVFNGGFTLEIAAEVCSVSNSTPLDTPLDTVDGVTSLVDKNLLFRTEGHDGEPRFMMLETIHEYALEHLVESGQSEIVRRRHAATFLRLAEDTEPHLRRDEQLGWLRYLDTEHDNLRAALDWSLGELGDPLLALRLVNALGHFWTMRAFYGEGSRWLDAALARAGESAPAHERAWALGFGCLLAVGLDDFPRGRRLGEAALVLARTLDDLRLIAYVARPLSLHQSCQGELEQAKMLQIEGLNAAHAIADRWAMTALLSELSPDIPEVAQAVLSDEKSFLALAREVGDRLLIPHTLYRLANTAARQGDRKAATKFLEEAVMIARQVNGKRGVIFFLQGLGQIHCAQGSHIQAESYYLEALEIAYQIGTPGMIAMIILRLGELAQARGQPYHALQRYQQCLKLVKDLDHQLLVAKCLSVMATLSGSPDSPLEATVAMQLEGAADALSGGRIFSEDLIDLAELNDRRSIICNQLADSMLATAWAEGNVMSLNAAIGYALTLGSHDALQSENHGLPRLDL